MTERSHTLGAMQLIKSLVRRPRLLGALAFAACLYAVLLSVTTSNRALLVAFDAGAALYLGLMFHMMSVVNVQSMRQRAQDQNQGKWALLITTISLVSVVVVALSGELHGAKDQSLKDVVLASISILLSWLFVATVFAQQYAHSFYMAEKQLGFPGTEQPDYWDFFYFSLVLSMCCQTSDVTVNSSHMRRLVMLHSISAFIFNIVIIGITVNVVAGVLQP